MEYTTNDLLAYALRMLDKAREEQLKSRKRDKWLCDNITLETIRERVALNERRPGP